MSKYKISRRIGRGGMAEVFLAVQEGIGGFEKLVVVKRIFPQFGNDDHFVSMFLQEARLAASIHHPSVVHIIDIEHDDDGYYLVMEYLGGESMAYIWEALRTRKQRMPPNLVCRIGSTIAAGLHHAHIATDAAGNPQPIVHRDVTPSNLIVCYNGVVKIVDFGVAKATLSEGDTRAGALKGKMSYLSPEQVRDEPIDGRTDVFQLGICLHEMLTGQRLFRGKGDHAKMSAILDTEIVPPSQHNPRVPRLLDEVVLKSLARNKEDRHQSAEALRRDLDAVLLELGSAASASEVGAWMQQTFTERHAERKQIERECVAAVRDGRAQRGPLSGLAMVMDASGRSQALRTPNCTSTHTPTHTPTRTPTMATVLERGSQSAVLTGIESRKRALWGIGAGALFVALISLLAWKVDGGDTQTVEPRDDEALSVPTVKPLDDSKSKPLDDSKSSPSSQSGDPEFAGVGMETQQSNTLNEEITPVKTKFRVAATPQNAEIYVDGLKIGVGEGAAQLVLNSAERTLIVQAPGYITKKIIFSTKPPPFVVRLEPDRAPQSLSLLQSSDNRSRAHNKSRANKTRNSTSNDHAPSSSASSAQSARLGSAPKNRSSHLIRATGSRKTDHDALEGKTDNVDPFAE